jgi:cell division protein FtsZ
MSDPKPTQIKVFGLGGGGSNAVNRMIDLGLEGVDFLAANTDAQALKQSLAPTKIQLGPKLTRGLGAGGRPETGLKAADESRAEMRAALAGADLVFLTAGMGGGTGTGSIAIAAEVAREVGALSVAIVTTPFMFEGTRRCNNAVEGLERLRPHVDTLITVPNDKLLPLLGRNTPFDVALRVADEVLRQGVQGLAELISKPGLINVDFSNVCAILHDAGNAMMAIGQGRGDDKAHDAIRQALKMPLLDLTSFGSATGILVHFTGGDDLGMLEVSQAADEIRRGAPNAEIIFGAALDPMMTGRAQVILVATGFEKKAAPESVRNAEAPAPAPARTPRPAPVQPPTPQELHLADALFSQALVGADADDQPWVPSEHPAAQTNNLDIPAFLRRRRSIRDFTGGK